MHNQVGKTNINKSNRFEQYSVETLEIAKLC